MTNPVGTPDNDNESTQEKKYSYEWWRAKVVEVKTLVRENLPTSIALLAFVVTVKACHNAWRSAGAAEVSAEAAQRSATAAEKSATAAQLNATTARKAFEANQRPSVNLGMPDGSPMRWRTLEAGKQGVIEMYFYNSGNAEAQEFFLNKQEFFPEITGVGPVSFLHIRPKSSLKLPNGGRNIPIVTTFPKGAVQTFTLKTQRMFTQDDIDLTQDRNKRMNILVEGTLEYVDVLGGYCCKNFSATWGNWVAEFKIVPPMRNNCPTSLQSVCDSGIYYENE